MTLGQWGEEVAAKYLVKKGYHQEAKNFRCKLGEIDLIMLYGDTLVFVEVKTRRNQRYGLPCEAVTPAKLMHISRVAAHYQKMTSAFEFDIRIDVIEILKLNHKTLIRHIENITG